MCDQSREHPSVWPDNPLISFHQLGWSWIWAGRELTKGEIKKVNKKLGLAQQWYVRDLLVLLVDLRTRAQPKLGSVRGGSEMTRGCAGPSYEAT